MRRPTWVVIALIAVVLAAREANGSIAAATSPSVAPDDGASGAASLFVKAWLDTHAGTRRAGLDASCTPRLAGLLALTAAAKVPDAVPIGVPVMVRQDAAGVTYVQRLSDETWVAVDLVPDPTRSAGWVVTAVRPGET